MRMVAVVMAVVLTAAQACLGQPAHPDEELIRNGTFDRDLAGWSQWFAPGQAEGGARWIARDDGGAMQVTVTRRDSPSAVQIYQGPFSVTAGEWYAVSFDAEAEREIIVRVALMGHNPPYHNFGLNAEVSVGARPQRYALLAQATADSDDARLDFFPGGSFVLDNVSVRPLGADPATCPVQEVHLGRGWHDNAPALVDGNPETVLASWYYPVMPLLVELDLGAPRPVGAVVVDAEDRGRHIATGPLEVEVSADGATWRRWARASRTPLPGPQARRPVRYTATNAAVEARHVRLRVLSLRNNAMLSGVRIMAAASGLPPDSPLWPSVPQERDVAFMGWDYHRLGYDTSPGEQVALRFLNQSASTLDLPLTWRLETYAGDEVAQGEGRLRAGPREPADVPLDLPHDRPDGHYRVRFTLGDEAHEAFHFDHRVAEVHPHLGLRLAALLDTQEPEGWVRMMAGPAAPFVDVRASLPDNPRDIDAALVTAEALPPDAPLVARLRSYLRQGGVVVFFGKVAPALDEMLPVDIDRDDPWLEAPQRLRPPAFWPQFDPAHGPRQYGMRTAPRPGAEVLAAWDDGAPALVAGRYGAGRVAHLGAPPGRTWQRREGMRGADELMLRTLYHLLDRPQAAGALTELAHEVQTAQAARAEELARRVGGADLPDAQPGASEGNFGRFGWLIEEGGLVENLDAGAQMRSPAVTTPWRLDLPGRGPLSGRVQTINWLSKTIRWDDEFGEALRSTVSIAAPCILWEGGETRLRITGDATHVAFASPGGVTVLGRGEAAEGDDMAAGWLVLFRADAEHRDAPRLVTLTRRPARISLDGELELDFGAQGFGALFTGRVFGLRRLAPGETARWAEEFPTQVARQAAQAAARCLAFPVNCGQVFRRDGESVVVASRFDHRRFGDDWGTAPETLAPLPPVLSLALAHGYPASVDGQVIATGIATKYGPLEGVAGERVVYRLPLPPRDHFGVIPVEGRMHFAEAIDHYALDGIGSVTRASGGLTTGDPFLEDLRAYMSSGTFENPFEAPCIDLYKWWYCFPTVLGRPAYGPDARAAVDAHHREKYRHTLNHYAHKSLVRYRREPWTKLDYTVTFIWPVHWRDGVRFLVDQNESAAVILYCLEAYARYYGDWATVASNWNLVWHYHNYLRRVHDWALMASSNQAYFSTVGIDMLNAEYPGNLALARMARQVGDARAEEMGLFLAAAAAVPTVARLYMPDYVEAITAPGDPWRQWRFFWSFHEGTISGDVDVTMRGDTEAVLALAIGMLDTSKGTGPEIALLYKRFAPERMEAYQRALQEAEREHDRAAGWAHNMQRAFLGWPREELLSTLERFHAERPRWGWQSTKAPHNLAVVCVADAPVFLAEWAPAEYVAGSYDPAERILRLTLDCHEPGPYRVRLYSRGAPERMTLNGAPFAGWSHHRAAGWLMIDLEGPGEARLEMTLGAETITPPHP